jgi:hypothetical protein
LNISRGPAKQGVNLRRVLLEPRDFDLVLWLQGSAAMPYLEPGEVNTEFWRQLATGMIHGRSDELGFELWR